MNNKNATCTGKMLNKFSKLVLKQSVKSANSACVFWHYQPEVPDQVKKLRKF